MEELSQYSFTSPGLQSPSRGFKSALGVKIAEARLSVNVAKIGDMKPYAVVFYGSQTWKTSISSGARPVWNSFYEFSYEPAESLTLFLYHKSLFFSDVEIGRVHIKLAKVARGVMEWWDLCSSLGDNVGNIQLSIEVSLPGLRTESSLVVSVHSPAASAEVSDFSRRRNFNFEAEDLSTKPKIKRDKLRRELQNSGFTFQTEEQQHIDQMRKDLEDERVRIEKQDAKVKKLYETLEAENALIKREKEELRRFKEEILQREEKLVTLRDATESEKRKLEEERRKVEEQKEQLNRGYEQLKKDKLKLTAKRKLLTSASQKIDGASRKLEKQKSDLLKQLQDSKEQESTFQQEWDEIEELRAQLKEKEELIQQQYEVLTREREACERERRELEVMKGLLDPPEHEIAEEETDKQPISVMVISEQVKHRVVSSESSHLRLALSPAK